MTTETRNEAAEQLIASIYGATGLWAHPEAEKAITAHLDDVLAAARRATVQRIRDAVLVHTVWTGKDDDTWTEGETELASSFIGDMLAILDEEAAR